MPPPFRTVPYAHQLREFELSAHLPTRALWWEMGCGKSKPVVDTACAMHEAGEIGGLLVLAPTGVHTNWHRDQLPEHAWDAVQERWRTFLWRTDKAATQWFQREWREFMEAKEGLKVLTMSLDGLMTDAGAVAVRKLLQSHRCLYVVDESDEFKSPGAKRTIRLQASSHYAPYRRVLSGTPVDESPFDAYTQVRFLDERIWKGMGISTPEAFRTTFGRYVKVQLKTPRPTKRSRPQTHFDKLVGFRHLDLLHQVMDAVGSRLLKRDVLDLPEKVYEKVYFELAPEQRRAYDQLRRDFLFEHHDGAFTTAELAITRLMRLQQITSGYLPADSEDELRSLVPPEKNPRLKLLREAVARAPGQVIVWAKFDIDVDIITAALRQDTTVVVYDGRTPDDERELAKDSFLAGSARVFLGKPSVAGRGLTLNPGTTVVYYNTDYRLSKRRQSEDRSHRIGQKNVVTYVDLVAESTIDSLIIESLRGKRELAAVVMGDELEKWI